MVLNDVEKVLKDLEKAELEAQDEEVLVQVYAQLLAIYLYQNELCYAKYLWQRIPLKVKANHEELQHIWKVGQYMWKRNWPKVHAALSINWSDGVAEIMNALKESTRERAMQLVSEAYSSLTISVLSAMMGLSEEQTQQAAIEKGWTIDGFMVQPRKVDREQSTPAQEALTEDQLNKLTQFVSFLEN